MCFCFVLLGWLYPVQAPYPTARVVSLVTDGHRFKGVRTLTGVCVEQIQWRDESEAEAVPPWELYPLDAEVNDLRAQMQTSDPAVEAACQALSNACAQLCAEVRPVPLTAVSLFPACCSCSQKISAARASC